MSGPPLVTIMIPTYNQARYLGEAIASALSQSYRNLEVVVADDASQDDTRVVAEGYLSDSRLRYVRNERNLGRVRNYRKLLFELAKGKWVLNLDGDDFLTDRDYVRDAVGLLEADPDAVMLIGAVEIRVPGRRPRSSSLVQRLERHPGVDWLLRTTAADNWPHLATLYRREAAMAAQCYLHDSLAADSECLRSTCLLGTIVAWPRIAGAWRAHAHNASADFSAGATIAALEAVSRVAKRAKDRGLPTDQVDRWRDLSMARMLVQQVYAGIGYGTWGESRKVLRHLKDNHPGAHRRVVRGLLLHWRFVPKLALALTRSPRLMAAGRRLVDAFNPRSRPS